MGQADTYIKFEIDYDNITEDIAKNRKNWSIGFMVLLRHYCMGFHVKGFWPLSRVDELNTLNVDDYVIFDDSLPLMRVSGGFIGWPVVFFRDFQKRDYVYLNSVFNPKDGNMLNITISAGYSDKFTRPDGEPNRMFGKDSKMCVHVCVNSSHEEFDIPCTEPSDIPGCFRTCQINLEDRSSIDEINVLRHLCFASVDFTLGTLCKYHLSDGAENTDMKDSYIYRLESLYGIGLQIDLMYIMRDYFSYSPFCDTDFENDGRYFEDPFPLEGCESVPLSEDEVVEP